MRRTLLTLALALVVSVPALAGQRVTPVDFAIGEASASPVVAATVVAQAGTQNASDQVSVFQAGEGPGLAAGSIFGLFWGSPVQGGAFSFYVGGGGPGTTLSLAAGKRPAPGKLVTFAARFDGGAVKLWLRNADGTTSTFSGSMNTSTFEPTLNGRRPLFGLTRSAALGSVIFEPSALSDAAVEALLGSI